MNPPKVSPPNDTSSKLPGLHWFIWAILLAGLCQSSLITYTKLPFMKSLDDLGASLLIAIGCLFALKYRSFKAIFVFLYVCALCFIALLRGNDFSTSFTQMKQVIFPGGFIFVGYVLQKKLDWNKIMLGQVIFAVIAALWTIIEWFLGKPLIDPFIQYQVLEETPLVRDGLPFSYVYDTANGGIAIRSGGPFMNPPMTGFFLGCGIACAVILGLRTRYMRYWIIVPILAWATYTAYARAGLLIFVMVTLVPLLWRILGRFVALVVTFVGALYVASDFLQQGNTASHAIGLQSGLLVLVTGSPLGLGFGSTGYQAFLSDSIDSAAGSESLIGLWATWLGLPFMALLFYASLRLIFATLLSSKPDLILLTALATFLAAGLSETASSTTASMVLWLISGWALSKCWGTGESLFVRSTPAMSAIQDEVISK